MQFPERFGTLRDCCKSDFRLPTKHIEQHEIRFTGRRGCTNSWSRKKVCFKNENAMPVMMMISIPNNAISWRRAQQFWAFIMTPGNSPYFVTRTYGFEFRSFLTIELPNWVDGYSPA